MRSLAKPCTSTNRDFAAKVVQAAIVLHNMVVASRKMATGVNCEDWQWILCGKVFLSMGTAWRNAFTEANFKVI